MKTYKFPCGCEFEIISGEGEPIRLKIQLEMDAIPKNCQKTWDFIGSGRTLGVFQIESQLGRKLSKELKPETLEHLAALTAIMRPACISGDTKILVKLGNLYDDNKKTHHGHKELRYLFNNPTKFKKILSFDETNQKIIQNEVTDIVFNGYKDVYKILCNIDKRNRVSNFYQIECTDDHKLLTNNGWKELKELVVGDRILVKKHKATQKTRTNIEGYKNFRTVCFQNYIHQCIFCDWSEGSLDVNHIDGSRQTNNKPENLHFVCPNHHRLITEGKISKDAIFTKREKFTLPKIEHMFWAIYLGKEYIGVKDVYDISMKSPHNNFFAGNVLVHNCLQSLIDGKSMTQHYMDRKNGLSPVEYYHPALENSLKDTYGCVAYQEEINSIVVNLADFTPEEAETLRKNISKKKADIIHKMRSVFIDKAIKKGVINEVEANQIFDWIQKCQRYLFCHGHAAGYGEESYRTAYFKAHFLKAFYCAWLSWAHAKINTEEVRQDLINEAKLFGIEVKVPNLRKRNQFFKVFDNEIYVGLTDIKGVGQAAYVKLDNAIANFLSLKGKEIDNITWLEYLIFISPHISSTANNAIMSSGGLDFLTKSRSEMIYEYSQFCELTPATLRWLTANYQDYPTLLDALKFAYEQKTGKGQPIAVITGKEKVRGIIQSLESPPYSLEDSLVWIAKTEKTLFGCSISCSEVDDKQSMNANCNCREFLNGAALNFAIIAAKIEDVKDYKLTKGQNVGQTMGFIKISDSTGMLDVVAFAETFKKYKGLLYKGNTITIGGSRGKKKDSGLVVEKVWQL